jgi:hypothetical protein
MTESGHAPISDTEACAALATTPATQDWASPAPHLCLILPVFEKKTFSASPHPAFFQESWGQIHFPWVSQHSTLGFDDSHFLVYPHWASTQCSPRCGLGHHLQFCPSCCLSPVSLWESPGQDKQQLAPWVRSKRPPEKSGIPGFQPRGAPTAEASWVLTLALLSWYCKWIAGCKTLATVFLVNRTTPPSQLNPDLCFSLHRWHHRGLWHCWHRELDGWW